MKTIINYLNAPSSIYKSVTRLTVVATCVVCAILLLIAATVETHPGFSIILTIVFALIFWLSKSDFVNKQKTSTNKTPKPTMTKVPKVPI